MYFKTLILMALLEVTATNPSIIANIGFDEHIVDDGKVPSEIENLGEDPHWCAIIDSKEKCSNPVVSKDCKKLCYSGEDPHWCAIIDAKEKCSNPVVSRDCKKLCYSDPSTPAPSPTTTLTTYPDVPTTEDPSTPAPSPTTTLTTYPDVPTTEEPTSPEPATPEPTTIEPTTPESTTPEPTTPAATTTDPVTCAAPAILVGGQCLQFVKEGLSWDAAVDACVSRGGDLASIQDPQGLRDYVKTIGDFWWVGASDTASEGTFVWLRDGTSAQQVPWWPGQPDNSGAGDAPPADCMYVWREGYADYGCDGAVYYICDLGGSN